VALAYDVDAVTVGKLAGAATSTIVAGPNSLVFIGERRSPDDGRAR